MQELMMEAHNTYITCEYIFHDVHVLQAAVDGSMLNKVFSDMLLIYSTVA